MKNIMFKYYEVPGKVYSMELDREKFMNSMNTYIQKFPFCSENAQNFRKIIPEMESLEISQLIIDSQDVPFVVYTTINGNGEKEMLRFRNTYRLIWSYFISLCEYAKKYGTES